MADVCAGVVCAGVVCATEDSDECSTGQTVCVTTATQPGTGTPTVCVGSSSCDPCCDSSVTGTAGGGNAIVERPPAPLSKCNAQVQWAGDHDGGIVWCNLCTDDDILVEQVGGTLVSGSTDMLCHCEDGYYLEFRDSITFRYTSAGARFLIDSLIIWQHDMTDAQISLTIDGSPVDFLSHCGTTAVFEKGVKYSCKGSREIVPFSMHWPAHRGNVAEVTIESPGQHCINLLALGRFLPLCLPPGTVNPFNGTWFTKNRKLNANGFIPSELTMRTIDVSLELAELSEEWLEYTWRAVRDYAERFPVFFLFSRNRLPHDVGLAELGDIEGSTYTDQMAQSLSLPLTINPHAGVLKDVA